MTALKTILVVEDEFLVAIDILETLESAGYRVVAIPDASRANDPSTGRFDAVLLDHGIDGEASETLADELIQSHVPFAFCTGLDAREFKNRYAKVPVIEKPFEPEYLLAVVNGFFEVRGD